MDPLAAKLSKLSVGRGQRQNRNQHAGRGRGRGGGGRGRGQSQDRRPPSASVQQTAGAVAGLRTAQASVQASASGAASRTSNVPTVNDSDDNEDSDSDDDEDNDSEDERSGKRSFPFFNLPYELRHKILRLVMSHKDTIDLNVNATWQIRMMPASRQFYEECCHAFYGANKFRLLPLHGPVFKKRTRPLIQFFSARTRAHITRLELRLGPHWKDPPQCWQIEDRLGLEDLGGLRRLDVMVECDPEHPVFAGFRRSKDFYTRFCGELLGEIIRRVPRLETVYIDSYPAVGRDSPLVCRLEKETLAGKKRVQWSSHLKLDDCYDVVKPKAGMSVYDTVVIRSMVMAEE